MKKRKRWGALLVALVMALILLPVGVWAAPEEKEVTILFTHDLHSHFLSQPDRDGGESGGYARLATAIHEERAAHPDALLVDGGDFSIGTLIQSLYTTHAAELRTMGYLGYDAVTLGNHEFDHTGTGLAEMLQAAQGSGDPLPAVVVANYAPTQDGSDGAAIQEAMEDYGVRDHILLDRNGVRYGIFGLMGEDAHDCAPTSGFELEDMAETAQRCVDELTAQGAEFIVCLSHSGTNEDADLSEDELLAQKVTGIDVIVSGHTHTTLTEPIVVGDTYLVSAGEYCENLGSITFSWTGGEKTLLNYRLIPIDEMVPEDPTIAAMTEGWKTLVGETYLAPYGLSYDQVLTTGGFDLIRPEYGVQEGNALGELVSDAFLWAVEHLESGASATDTVAVTADGVLRADLPAGEITTSMAFDVLSMGVGDDGTSGYPLVGVYLTGKEVKAAMEVDASVTPIMPAAQLYMSGVQYSFNIHRMFFNRVTDSALAIPVFSEAMNCTDPEEIEDDRLYRVVTGMYSAQMLGTVKGKSMGLLSLEPKDAEGNPITDFSACILRDEEGNEIKEWYALAAYLSSFGEEGIPEHYSQSDGRKEVSASWNPVELLRGANWITLTVLAVAAAVLLGAVFLVRRIVRRGRNKQK